MKCIDCESEIEFTKEIEGKEMYLCENGHTNSRMVDHESVKTVDHEGEVIHESVGAIIRAEGDILLLKRRKFPYKYSIPAGHMEDGEEAYLSLLREIEEETGIKISGEKRRLAYEGILEDKCRRGADKHKWHLYFIELEEKPEVDGNDEADHLTWINNPLDNQLTDITEKFLNPKMVELSVNLAKKLQ